MNRITALGLASLVAYGLLIGSKYAGFVPPAREARDAPTIANASVPAGESGVLPANPEPRPAVSFPAPIPVTASRPSAAAQDFRATRDLRAFADQLATRKPALTGDERYYLARTLEECLFATSVNEDLAAYSARQRRQFVAGLPHGDAGNARRVAAFEALDNTQRCLKFQNAKISPKEIEDLYLAAAQQGDPRAQARMLVAELSKNAQRGATTSTEAAVQARTSGDDLSRLIGLLESRDPEAVVTVGQFLAQQGISSQLRIGPNAEVPEPSALLGAFSLVACDFGSDCSAHFREQLNACAYAGYCSSQSYDELYQNFLASPWVYAQAMRYRGIILNAINTRNWSLLGLGPPAAARTTEPQ